MRVHSYDIDDEFTKLYGWVVGDLHYSLQEMLEKVMDDIPLSPNRKLKKEGNSMGSCSFCTNIREQMH